MVYYPQIKGLITFLTKPSHLKEMRIVSLLGPGEGHASN